MAALRPMAAGALSVGQGRSCPGAVIARDLTKLLSWGGECGSRFSGRHVGAANPVLAARPTPLALLDARRNDAHVGATVARSRSGDPRSSNSDLSRDIA